MKSCAFVFFKIHVPPPSLPLARRLGVVLCFAGSIAMFALDLFKFFPNGYWVSLKFRTASVKRHFPSCSHVNYVRLNVVSVPFAMLALYFGV